MDFSDLGKFIGTYLKLQLSRHKTFSILCWFLCNSFRCTPLYKDKDFYICHKNKTKYINKLKLLATAIDGKDTLSASSIYDSCLQ